MNKAFKKIIIIIAILAFSFFIFVKWFDKQSVVEEGEISIYDGASMKQIADILERNGTIKSSNIFFGYIKVKQFLNDKNPFSKRPFEVSFKAGEFQIESGDFDSLIETLNDARNIDPNNIVSVTIPEGFTLEQIAELLDKNKVVEKEVFLKRVNSRSKYNELRKRYLWLPEENKNIRYLLEGYLQANTYQFKEESNIDDVILKLLEPTNGWYEKEKITLLEKGLEFSKVITLASIIERESKFSEDRPKVSAVFHNRLEQGMPLQSDITALYAKGKHEVYVTYDDINIDSPYNTYQRKGLPIGPIGSPSEESFRAALYPEEGFPHLYFYARPSGETFYTSEYKEHLKFVEQYDGEWLELHNKEKGGS